MKKCIQVFKFLFSLEEHTVYYSDEKNASVRLLCLTPGLYKFYHTSAQMGIPCIKCVLEELWKTILKTHKRHKFLNSSRIYRR